MEFLILPYTKFSKKKQTYFFSILIKIYYSIIKSIIVYLLGKTKQYNKIKMKPKKSNS